MVGLDRRTNRPPDAGRAGQGRARPLAIVLSCVTSLSRRRSHPEAFEGCKASKEVAAERIRLMTEPTASSLSSIRRRQLLEAAGTVAVGGTAATLLDAHTAVAAVDAGSKLKEYFSILATGEALFVTFYSNAVANHQALGLAGAELNAIRAILVEEQIHYDF